MKGVFKCGPLLVLSIIFGLSLVVCSDTNALKHQYVAIPYFSNNSINGISFYDSISISGVNTTTEENVPFNKTPAPLVFLSESQGGLCQYTNGFASKIVSENYVSINFPSYYKTYNNSGNYNEPASRCQRAGLEFGQNPPPGMNWDSLPSYIFGNPDYRSFNPYYYEYSHAYLSDQYIDTESGQHYTSRLTGESLFGFKIHSFYELQFPLEFIQSNVGAMTAGRDVEFRGVFDFSNSTFSWGNGVQDGSFYIRYRGQTESQLDTDDFTQGEIQCTANLRQIEANNFAQLEYSCPWKVPVDFAENALGFTLDLNAGSGQYVWVTDGDLNWAGLYIITDKDETPGVNANSTPTGNYLSEAPGNAQANVDSGNVDWTGSLTDLFSFNLLNPFYPIFTLFTGDESCAQIPTLAGMIHSEETEVCHWFSSTTRNIVTPVLGLASMMLLFGFVVHWLGARSGNMFEDSVATDNYSFRSRVGGRKK